MFSRQRAYYVWVIDAGGRSIDAGDALYLDGDSVPVGLRVASIRVKLHASVADELGVSRGTFRRRSSRSLNCRCKPSGTR